MKVIFCVVAFAFCVVLAFPETTSAPKYPVKYDNIDVDIILNTDRLLKSYVDCLLEKTKCHTKQAQLLKQFLPDALRTKCARCSEKQKIAARKIFKHLLQHKREYYDQLEAKYDPDHVYRNSYREEAKKEGIII